MHIYFIEQGKTMYLRRKFILSMIFYLFLYLFTMSIYLKHYYFSDNNPTNYILPNTVESTANYTVTKIILQSFPWLKVNINMSVKEHESILIPSTTRMMKHPNISMFTLTKDCLPSLIATFEDKFYYTIYIGIGKDDFLQSQTRHIERLFHGVRIVTVPGNTFTAATNYIANQAFQDGMDYLVRINDDSVFQTTNWTSLAVDSLKKYDPQNVGVVGPLCTQGNRRILTHDMVHRTHLKVFGYYYPPVLDNLWTDDWITLVYAPKRSKKLQTWKVEHLVSANGRRYNAKQSKRFFLKDIIESDKSRLHKYILETENN